MADFTLNAPGTTDNPWMPANTITPVGALKLDSITPTVTFSSPGGDCGDEIWAGFGGGAVKVPDWLLKRTKGGDILVHERRGNADCWLLNGAEQIEPAAA